MSHCKELSLFLFWCNLKAVSETTTSSDINHYNINTSIVKSSYYIFYVTKHIVKCWGKSME